MGQSIEFTLVGNRFSSLEQFLKQTPKSAIDALKSATLYTEKVIKKDFMTVQDGDLSGISKSSGQRRYPKRVVRPGVRTSTGNLKRNTRSTFRVTYDGFEGAIGTDVGYGVKLDQDARFEFLKPGLEKAKPEIQKMLNQAIEARLINQ